ncbi:MAG: hypothetical protein PHO14_00400 [Kiritimatiellae bacterium]|nr:hypothetical protein [Kiritimatiellia bacterium]MDD4340674.1 hypothetical protein [Kiritimatiellia bacterium]
MSELTPIQDSIDAAQAILDDILRLLEFQDAQVESTVENGQIYFQITTTEAGRLIGRTAQSLDAIQFLLNRMMSRKYDDSPYCVVDTEGYRAQRQEKLLADTQQALDHVRQTGQSWRMPLLNSMDRRLVHQALKDCPDIETYSEDEEPDGRKRVVIALVDLEPLSDDQPADEPSGEPATDTTPSDPV